jgi:hypothetical protein
MRADTSAHFRTFRQLTATAVQTEALISKSFSWRMNLIAKI